MGSNFTNVSVSEIQRIQRELKARNFTQSLINSGMEKNLAKNASSLAQDLLNKTMMLVNLVKNQNDTIGDMISTFLAINKGAKNAFQDASKGTELVKISKMIDFQVSESIIRLSNRLSNP